jgi:predicted transcriptional regulator
MARPRRVRRSVQVEPESLPSAELEVLGCLWRTGPATAAEIRAQLASFRPMAHGSAVTLLKRLVRKGLVARQKSGHGKAHLYRAVPTPRPMPDALIDRITRRIFGGSKVALLASLLEISPPSADELKEMKRLLRQVRENAR